ISGWTRADSFSGLWARAIFWTPNALVRNATASKWLTTVGVQESSWAGSRSELKGSRTVLSIGHRAGRGERNDAANESPHAGVPLAHLFFAGIVNPTDHVQFPGKRGVRV